MKNLKNILPLLHPYRAKRLLPTPAQLGAWVAILAFTLLTGAALMGRDRLVVGEDITLNILSNPTRLSEDDRARYSLIERAQARGDFATADRLIQELENKGLLGYALAERYLSPAYAARPEELQAWLKHYSDLPQAPRVAAQARAHGIRVAMPATDAPLKGAGSGHHLGRSAMPDSWYTAMSHWRNGQVALAAPIFRTIAATGTLNDWQRSAAHYWAARADARLGAAFSARTHLLEAAKTPTTFYGMLANEKLGRAQPAAQAPEVSDALRREPRAIRASLLAQIDRKEDAETELRALYSTVGNLKRPGIVTLASEMNLPNLQMRLARTPGLSDAEKLFAQYPTPPYMMALDGIVDSALLMAVARNESAFHEQARNPRSGATGMMQMLPSTARAVERRVGETLLREASLVDAGNNLADRLYNPSLSARYGAEYLRILNNEPVISGNLIHLLVGYNAGPGTLGNWKSAARGIEDPLVFIESIPYAETRNYVMQVLAQYWIYQNTMDEKAGSLKTLSQDQWPMLRAGM